jgi:periplasmic glucans biosynthesis protein
VPFSFARFSCAFRPCRPPRPGALWFALSLACAGVLAALSANAELPPTIQVPATPARSAASPFDFERLAEAARQRASRPYRATPASLPAELRDIDYDGLRDIRFRPDKAVWRGSSSPFELMFFHLGLYQTQPVRLHELTPQGARDLPFDAHDFDYGHNQLSPGRWGDIGVAGWRAHFPLNSDAYKDELVAFLGASYFRALGRGQHYGLSARGLAIDTVGGAGEEFPRFTDFWFERPAAGARSLVVLALLDSVRASGAYRFEIVPGEQTTMAVRARLYLRAPAAGQPPIATLGIAPLTSMFAFGENQPQAGDFRPEVHDSDGLQVALRNGEWLWRPLLNPSRTLVTSFQANGLAGFGLMQRDRRFASYEDGEAHYQDRPSAWVTPQGEWGAGRVELVLLPTPDETHDNVVVYWVPDRLPPAGQPLDLAWQVAWQGRDQTRPPGAWVSQTRSGRSYRPLAAGERQFIVDFTGPSLAGLDGSSAVEAVVSSDANGRVVEQTAYRLDAAEAGGAWRLALRVQTIDPSRPVELRAFLRSRAGTSREATLSETWTNLIPPQ